MTEYGLGSEGYVDDGETRKKVLSDVFERGDRWFNTGDLLKCDDEGDYWFVDRLGDTFRWKGENISTEEVNLVMSKLDWLACSTVYGVKVPDQEGRVGMVAVELREGAEFDASELYKWLESQLPEGGDPTVRPNCELVGYHRKLQVFEAFFTKGRL